MGKGGNPEPGSGDAAPGEEAGASTAPDADPACVQWVKDRIHCSGITPEMWSAEHDDTLSEFLSTPTQQHSRARAVAPVRLGTPRGRAVTMLLGPLGRPGRAPGAAETPCSTGEPQVGLLRSTLALP